MNPILLTAVQVLQAFNVLNHFTFFVGALFGMIIIFAGLRYFTGR